MQVNITFIMLSAKKFKNDKFIEPILHSHINFKKISIKKIKKAKTRMYNDIYFNYC